MGNFISKQSIIIYLGMLLVSNTNTFADGHGGGAGGGGTCPSGGVCTPSGSTSTGDNSGDGGAGNTSNVGQAKGSVTSGSARTAIISVPARPKTAIPWLKHFKHNVNQCKAISGASVVDIDSGTSKICKITAASCPAGWSKEQKYSATAAKTCTGSDLSAGTCTGGTPVNCTTGSHTFGNTANETCAYKNVNKCGTQIYNSSPASYQMSAPSAKLELKKDPSSTLVKYKGKFKYYSKKFSKYLPEVISTAHAYLNVECSCAFPDGFGSGWAIEKTSSGAAAFKAPCDTVAMKAGTSFTSNGKFLSCVDPSGANGTWTTIPSACKTAMSAVTVQGGWAAGCGFPGFNGTGGDNSDSGWYKNGDNSQCCDGGKSATCTITQCKKEYNDYNDDCIDLWSDSAYDASATGLDSNSDSYDDGIASYCNDPTKFTPPGGLGSCQPLATCNTAAPPASCCLFGGACVAITTAVGCY